METTKHSAHPDAAKIEAMARAAVSALGGDPDERVGHGWYDAWDPHYSPAPDVGGDYVPDMLCYSERWMLRTKDALATLSMMRAAGGVAAPKDGL